jgi:hypothetical protein
MNKPLYYEKVYNVEKPELNSRTQICQQWRKGNNGEKFFVIRYAHSAHMKHETLAMEDHGR